MNKIEKLYRSMYENELRKLRKCAESVQKLSQYVAFKAWSEEVMAYLFFKIDRLDYIWEWEYKDKNCNVYSGLSRNCFAKSKT